MTTQLMSESNCLSNGGQTAFLNRVARDDGFRAELEANPLAALAQYELEIDPSLVPAKVTLPSLDELQGHLDGMNASDSSWWSKFWVGFVGQ